MTIVVVDNPRIIALASALHIRITEAAGMIIYLLQYVEKYAPDGNIGGILSDPAIALIMDWPQDDAPRLLHALTSTTLPGQHETWLQRHAQHGLIVSGWYTLAPIRVHERLLREGRRFATGEIPKAYHCRRTQRIKLLAQYNELLPPDGAPSKPKPTPARRKPKPDTAALTAAFDALWAIYPKKAGKKPALEKYLQLNPPPETQQAILTGVKTYSAACLGKDPAYILHLKTYLNQARWLDVLPSAAQQKSFGAPNAPEDFEPREPSLDDLEIAEGAYRE
jgi:hypothetical protein